MQIRKPALVRRGAIVSRPRAEARQRPGALPVPAQSATRAITPPAAFDRWSDEAAGVRALALGDNVITMMEIIGEDFWTGGGVTAKKVAAQLRAIGDRPVEVQINSPGGDMFEGIAIYNVLREHPQPITVKVMGMAASAASIIAMAGDSIEIGAASFLMIHNCWVVAVGNRHDMAETAAFLEPFDTAMAGVYAERSGLRRQENPEAGWTPRPTCPARRPSSGLRRRAPARRRLQGRRQGQGRRPRVQQAARAGALAHGAGQDPQPGPRRDPRTSGHDGLCPARGHDGL
jgi:ATP-dependent protease ClpP protease subunit